MDRVTRLIACAGLGVLLWAAPADASCAGEDSFVAPADGAVDVPTNAKIWLTGMWKNGRRLLDPDGHEVEVDVATLSGAWATFTILTPKVPLTPGALYRLTSVNAYGGAPLQASFRVGDGSDITPPRVVDVSQHGGVTTWITHSLFNDSLGPSNAAYMRVAHEGVVGLVSFPGQHPVLEGTHRFVAAAFTGPIVAIGRVPCSGTWERSPDELKPGAVTKVQFGAFDLAGNFSGWTDPVDARVPWASTRDLRLLVERLGVLSVLLLIPVLGWVMFGFGRRRRGR